MSHTETRVIALMKEACDVSNKLAQFVDYFEDFEALAIAQHLAGLAFRYPDLWRLILNTGMECRIEDDGSRTLDVNDGAWFINFKCCTDISVDGPFK